MPNTQPDSQQIWMQGELVPYEKANVHVLSHSLHYGGATFEGMRAYATSSGKTALFRAPEHFKRLFDSMALLGYSIPFTSEQLIGATKQTIRANRFKECYIRPIAYINDTVRGLKLPPQPEVLTAIATWDWGKYLGKDGINNGVRIKTSSYRRPDAGSALSMAKLSGPYVYSVLARREAAQSGYDEALLLDPQGFVAEGSGENIFAVKGAKIATPQLGSILPGITRDCVIQIARHLGFEVVERPLTRNELYLSDEVFFTGTAAEVTPIREIDNHQIGTGKAGVITQKISEVFFACTRGEVPEFKKWLIEV